MDCAAAGLLFLKQVGLNELPKGTEAPLGAEGTTTVC